MPILIRMTPIPVCDDLLPLGVPPPLARLFSEVAQLSKTYADRRRNSTDFYDLYRRLKCFTGGKCLRCGRRSQSRTTAPYLKRPMMPQLPRVPRQAQSSRAELRPDQDVARTDTSTPQRPPSPSTPRFFSNAEFLAVAGRCGYAS
jgi:hypothetical protein